MIEEGAAADTVTAAGESAGQSTKAVTISSFLLNLAMSASLSELWGMIHGLQIMTHMPITNIKFPANAE